MAYFTRRISDFPNSKNKILTKDIICSRVLKAEYAVRGKIVIRAEELVKDLQDPEIARNLPFKSIYLCNIGNPQALGQMPITFYRQVLAACIYPSLIDIDPPCIPADACDRARRLLGEKNTIGAYTHSQGYPHIRVSVSNFIKQRDGHAADANDIFLFDGASPAVKTVLQMLISSEKDGILIPIPQYPLYSAAITLLGGTEIGYYLDERSN